MGRAIDGVKGASSYIFLAELLALQVQAKFESFRDPLVNALVVLPGLIPLVDYLSEMYSSLFSLGEAKLRMYFANRTLERYNQANPTCQLQD